jgi:hypothetical protein
MIFIRFHLISDLASVTLLPSHPHSVQWTKNNYFYKQARYPIALTIPAAALHWTAIVTAALLLTVTTITISSGSPVNISI